MLSNRGARWAKVDYAHGKQNLYHPINNSTGIVSFSNAENHLMKHDLVQFINEHSDFDKSCCAYGEMFTGTHRLRTAMAKHLNKFFNPALPIDAEHLTFTAGVTDLNEVCALLTCNGGEAVMLGRPVYGSFFRDLTTRTEVNIEYVSVGDIDQFTEKCVAGYEKGYEEAKARGVNIKCLMICNPHNPLGQCYPRETLLGLLRFCSSKGIHLISDEIYGLSVYDRKEDGTGSFTSLLSIDPTGIIDPNLVHVLYGMSKDFAAGGLRLGCLISKNPDFVKATRAICRFSSPSQFSMEIAAKILEDQTFVSNFLKTSATRLRKAKAFTEDLLDKENISYHKKGTAGFFIWLDLSSSLTPTGNEKDSWEAEKRLSEQFQHAGVEMSTGAAYHAPNPGRFRLIFSLDEDSLREGIKRISSVINSEKN